ncbi:hypothetical protein KM043_017290 [Ampulex compressa]|nr:hypothetical protein KM043_017290 [Ampulex compressa]
MRISAYNRYTYYLRSTGTGIIIVGSCWVLYQLRSTSQILRSVVPTNILDLEQAHAQYIYIDDPRFKDVFMFREDKTAQSSALKTQHGLSTIVMKWWKSLNRNLAYRLLHMAQHGNKSERYKAVHTLNSLKYLKDWHYRHIAQMLDARTAIALARMKDVDLRFFLPPPYYHVQHKLHDVIEKIHSLLLHLNHLCSNTHPCLAQFLNTIFKDPLREGLIFDHDLPSMGLGTPSALVWNQELLVSCVQALCHHSSLEKYSKDIVAAGGLLILMMIKQIFENNIDVCVLLAKIVSNISIHTEYLNDIFTSGWMGTLVEWSHNDDIRLSIPAGRALANLDIDENENIKYPRRIYLLYPLYKTCSSTKLDVVFLHGLLGSVFVTWRQRDPASVVNGVIDPSAIDHGSDVYSAMLGEHPQEFFKDLAHDLQMHEWNKLGQDFQFILDDCPEKTNGQADGPYFCAGDDKCVIKCEHDRRYRTQCWPKDWLPEDVPSLRILGVNYDTNLSMWTNLCPIDGRKTTMKERSTEYTEKLLRAGIGLKPIIWVCHSMGGLIVKKMLVEEWKNGDKHNICKNTRGILFYSTPHRGSHVAVLAQTTQMLVWPSIEVQELREESPELLKLHEEFLNMLKVYPIQIVSFSETKPTTVTALKLSYQFVSSHSADPGVGEFYEIPQDHLSICKPASRQSFLYQKLLSILRCHANFTRSTKELALMEVSLPRKLS